MGISRQLCIMQTTTACLALFASAASAYYTGNLNYFSPSLHHPSLAVSIRKVATRTYAASPWDPSQLNFTHGVASGDPYEDSVILWTRAAPTSDNDRSNKTVSGYVGLYTHENDEFVKASNATVCVEWRISETKDLSRPVDAGTAYTSSDIDFTIKARSVGRLLSLQNFAVCRASAADTLPGCCWN